MIKLEYEKICKQILECDKNIRYAGIYDFGELYGKMRPGLKSHLSREETEVSLSDTVVLTLTISSPIKRKSPTLKSKLVALAILIDVAVLLVELAVIVLIPAYSLINLPDVASVALTILPPLAAYPNG